MLRKCTRPLFSARQCSISYRSNYSKVVILLRAMDINLKLFLLVLLSAPALGRVRRQGTLEDTPVLPFSAQSKPGDESPSIEVQNENAEKGIVDNKDAGVEEVLEYVDESGPGSDPDAEVDQSLANEEPDIDAIVQDGQQPIGISPIGRGFQENAVVPESFFERPYFGRQSNETVSTPGKTTEKPWYKNSTVWIIVGVIGGIILLLICICICVKCRK